MENDKYYLKTIRKEKSNFKFQNVSRVIFDSESGVPSRFLATRDNHIKQVECSRVRFSAWGRWNKNGQYIILLWNVQLASEVISKFLSSDWKHTKYSLLSLLFYNTDYFNGYLRELFKSVQQSCYFIAIFYNAD